MIRQAFVSLAALPALIGVAASTSVPGGSGTSEFAEQLDRIPAALFTADTAAMLQYVDMTEVWKRLGIGADPTERLDNLGATSRVETYGQPTALFGAYAFDVDGARGEIGMSIVDLDREIALLAPPRQIIVAESTVPTDAVVTAVETDPLWSDVLTVQHGPDGDYWQWGDEPGALEPTRRSSLRPLGRGGVLALVDGEPATVIRAIEPADVESAQRTMAGTEASLLDAGPMADAAAVLGDVTVIQALGTADPVLIAEVIDGEATTTQILWPLGTPEAAADFVAVAQEFLAGDDPVTQQPTSELLPGATVDAVGSVVRLTAPAPTYRTAVTMLMNRALPLGASASN